MSRIRLYGDTTGYVELKAPDVSENNTVTLPNSPVIQSLPTASQTIEAQQTNVVPLILKGNAGQTSNLFELKNSSGTTVLSINPSGSISASGFVGNLTGNASGNLLLSGGTMTGTISGQHINPSATNTYDLGTSSLRWRNIFTQDLHLSNGIGDYTIVEGEEDLYLTNNKNGKSYKFALIEVDSSEVPPKSES
jgi:hypothetical protein